MDGVVGWGEERKDSWRQLHSVLVPSQLFWAAGLVVFTVLRRSRLHLYFHQGLESRFDWCEHCSCPVLDVPCTFSTPFHNCFFEHIFGWFRVFAIFEFLILFIFGKVPKWSQKCPNFASKSQLSDSTFRCSGTNYQSARNGPVFSDKEILDWARGGWALSR